MVARLAHLRSIFKARSTSTRKADLRSESGQSLIELLFMMPVMIAFPFVLVKVATVIEMSIVDQQHARAHVFFIAHNSPYYPKRYQQKSMYDKDTNQVVMGISENNLKSDGDGGGGTYSPKASTYSIARTPKVGGSDSSDKEPTERTLVRVRNTFSLCAYSTTLFDKASGKAMSHGPVSKPGEVKESSAYHYCGTKLEGLAGMQ